MRDADIDELATEIAEYLARHPEAADSLDGIVHWWVGRQRFDCSATRVREALERLVARGLVRRWESGDGTCYYARGAAPPSRH